MTCEHSSKAVGKQNRKIDPELAKLHPPCAFLKQLAWHETPRPQPQRRAKRSLEGSNCEARANRFGEKSENEFHK